MELKQERRFRELKQKNAQELAVNKALLPKEKEELFKYLMTYEFNYKLTDLLRDYDEMVGVDVTEIAILSSIFGHAMGDAASALTDINSPQTLDKALDKFSEVAERQRQKNKEIKDGLI